MEERLKILITQIIYKVKHPDLRIAIPLYSSNPSLHNYVVQAENALMRLLKEF